MPRPRHITPRELLERSDGRVHVAGRPGAFLPGALFAGAVDLLGALAAQERGAEPAVDFATFADALPATASANPSFSLGATMLLPGYSEPPSVEDLLARLDGIPRTTPAERVFQLSQHIVAWIGSDRRVDEITVALGQVSIEILCQEGLWREFAVEINGMLQPLFASETQFFATMLAMRGRCTDAGRISHSRKAAKLWLQLYHRGFPVPRFPSSLECLSRRKNCLETYGEFVATFNRAPSPSEIKQLAEKPVEEQAASDDMALATTAPQVSAPTPPTAAPSANELVITHLHQLRAYVAKITGDDPTAELMFETALRLAGSTPIPIEPVPPANPTLADYVHPANAPTPFTFRDDPNARELVLRVSSLPEELLPDLRKEMPHRAPWVVHARDGGPIEIHVPLSQNETEEHAQRAHAHTWATKLALLLRTPPPEGIRETARIFPR